MQVISLWLLSFCSRFNILSLFFIMGTSKNGVKSKNGQGVPASRKSDEVWLYALRGGATRCCRAKLVRTAHFRSHEVFRGDLIPYSLKNAQLSLDFFDKLKRAGAEPARHF